MRLLILLLVYSLTLNPGNVVFSMCSNIRDTTTELAYVKLAIVKVSPSERPLSLAASLFSVSFSASSEISLVSYIYGDHKSEMPYYL